MKSQFLEAGKIVTTHGVAGAVKLECWCDNAKTLAKLPRLYFKKSGIYTEKKVLTSSVYKDMVICRLEGIENIDDAAKLRGCIVYSNRDDLKLKEGAYFIADLIGLDVLDYSDGRKYGVIKDVITSGATDIYVITDNDGNERMMPAVDEFVKKIDTEAAVFVSPIPGMLDDNYDNG